MVFLFLCIYMYTFTVFVPADGNVVKALWLQIIKFVCVMYTYLGSNGNLPGT